MNTNIRNLSDLLESAELPWEMCNELNSLLIEMSVEDIPKAYQQNALDHVSRVLLHNSAPEHHRKGLEKIYEYLSGS